MVAAPEPDGVEPRHRSQGALQPDAIGECRIAVDDRSGGGISFGDVEKGASEVEHRPSSVAAPGRRIARRAAGRVKAAVYRSAEAVSFETGHRGRPQTSCHAVGAPCRVSRRVDDGGVAGAPAQMTAEHLANSVLVRLRLAFEEVMERHQDPGGTVAALQRMVTAKRRLQLRERLPVAQPLHGFDGGAVDLHGEHQARPSRLAVDPHGARAAYAVLAADMDAGRAEHLPQEIRE